MGQADGRGDECRHPQPGTGLAYGLRRVVRRRGGMARSSFYAMTSGQHCRSSRRQSVGDTNARDLGPGSCWWQIEADLASASPWEGEGYRKVWARLRVCRDIRVARKRVLRLMRENNLLSLNHRCTPPMAAIPMTVRSSLMP